MLLRAISLTLLLTTSVALADDMKTPLNAKDLKWGPAPNVFPKGAQIAIVSGDPFKDGPYVLRFKIPRGYKIPAHNHPTSENLTILSGNFHIGMGDKLEHFPFSVNRRDSQGAANKILWPSRVEEAGNGVFERSASSSDPGC